LGIRGQPPPQTNSKLIVDRDKEFAERRTSSSKLFTEKLHYLYYFILWWVSWWLLKAHGRSRTRNMGEFFRAEEFSHFWKKLGQLARWITRTAQLQNDLKIETPEVTFRNQGAVRNGHSHSEAKVCVFGVFDDVVIYFLKPTTNCLSRH
jgi:hypothetical protein